MIRAVAPSVASRNLCNTTDLGLDALGCGRPPKGLGVLVSGGDEAMHGALELPDRLEAQTLRDRKPFRDHRDIPHSRYDPPPEVRSSYSQPRDLAHGALLRSIATSARVDPSNQGNGDTFASPAVLTGLGKPAPI